jgi:hypothetical protein
MAIRLLNADHGIIPTAVRLLRFLDGQIDGLTLIMAVADDAPFLIGHVPAVLRRVVVNVIGVIGTGLLGGLCHYRPLSVLVTRLRLLPAFFTALRTAPLDLPVFLAS